MGVFIKIAGVVDRLLQIGLGGPQIKNDGGAIAARDSQDAAFVPVRVADPVGPDDAVTLRALDARAPLARLDSAGSVGEVAGPIAGAAGSAG